MSTLIIGASPDLVELAKLLGRDGERIGLLSRNEIRLKDYKERLSARGIASDYFVADVTEMNSVQPAFEQVAAWSSKLDRLIYNVGVVSNETAVNLTSRGIHRVMDSNFFGFVNCFQLALPLLRHAGQSQVITLSSARALNDEEPAAYAASKAALRIYLGALRRELSRERIRFSEVYLGQQRDANGWRDLICEEIVDGLLKAAREFPDRLVIGESAESSNQTGD